LQTFNFEHVSSAIEFKKGNRSDRRQSDPNLNVNPVKIFEYEISTTVHTVKDRNMNSLQGWDLTRIGPFNFI